MAGEDDYHALKAEVAALQMLADERKGPWIAKPSNLLSVLALLFSFSTTLFSLWKAHQAEVATNRAEVRQLIQRITRLPIENFELIAKYQGNIQGQQLSSMIVQEQLLLANQSAEKINKYPNTFTSTEYFAVAGALATVNSPTYVGPFLQRAIELATTANDFVVASRSYGHYLFTQGKVQEGRAYYSKALVEVWSKFPGSDPSYRLGLQVQTSLNLANSELIVGNKRDAMRAVSDAKSFIDEMTIPQAKDYWFNQLMSVQLALARSGSSTQEPSLIQGDPGTFLPPLAPVVP
jgi:tetratricopeptide (TPR) repeat protein